MATRENLIRRATETVKKLANDEKVREKATETATEAAVAVGTWAGRLAARWGRTRFGERTHRRDAILQARQYEHGRVSENLRVAGRPRYVVWNNGAAVAVYPMLTERELDHKPLAGHPELQDVAAELLLDPHSLPLDPQKESEA